MNPNVLRSYLVSLGFAINQPQLQQFNNALKQAADLVAGHTTGILTHMLKWETAIVGAMVTVSGAVIGLADRFASADQQYRLLGLHMFATKETAMKMKIATDALGASMGEIRIDPELHERALILFGDIDRLQHQLGPGFDAGMRKIRDIHFEFTRFSNTLSFLGRQVILTLLDRFGNSTDDVLTKLRDFNAWFQEHVPEIANKIADFLIPILKETWEIIKSLAKAAYDVAKAIGNILTAFDKLDEALGGEDALDEQTKKMSAFGRETQAVADFAEDIATYLADAVGETAHLINALTALVSRDWAKAGEEAKLALGAAPERAAAKRKRGGDSSGLSWLPNLQDSILEQAKQAGADPKGAIAAAYREVIIQEARRAGIDPRIALSVAQQESGFSQTDKSGRTITSEKGARGFMQLMPDTAKWLGVDPDDPLQNIHGGVTYLAKLSKQYGGDWTKALEAYYTGPGNVDAALAGRRNLRSDVPLYAQQVLRRAEGINVDVGGIHVAVNQPNASADQVRAAVQEATVKGIKDAMRVQTTLDLGQMAPAF